MSTREMAYELINSMSEEQLKALLQLFGAFQKNTDDVDSVCGIFHDAADEKLIPTEKGAWERAAVEKYENS